MTGLVTYTYSSESLLVGYWEEIGSNYYTLTKFNLDSETEYYLEPTSIGDNIKAGEIVLKGIISRDEPKIWLDPSILN